MGTTSDEGAFNVLGTLLGKIPWDEINEHWDSFGPLLLFHRSVDERSQKVVKEKIIANTLL